jgi:hypothetical protein
MMGRITCDENGFVRGFPYHDGSLDGVLVGGSHEIHVAMRAVSGEQRVITLRGVKRLCVDEFREGNILLNIRVLPLAGAVSVPQLSQRLVDRLHLDLANMATDGVIFWLEGSYGAEVIAVCDSVDVSESGFHLVVQG